MEPTVQQFKVGDKVTTHKQGKNWRYGGRMTDGASGVIDRLADKTVEVRLTDGDEWTYHASELRPASETPQFKVGDCVQVKDETVSSLRFWDRSFGKRGTITALDTDHTGRPKAKVEFGEDDYDEGHPDNLTLIKPAALTHPQAIMLDGITYTLTPVAEAPAEEQKREPKRGEVWREGAMLALITDEGRGGEVVAVVLHDADRYSVEPGLVIYRKPTDADLTYAYPTLAAAIADGALS